MNCLNIFGKLLAKPSQDDQNDDQQQQQQQGQVLSLPYMRCLLQEKVDECKRKERELSMLNSRLEDQNWQLKHLRNELDKYRQLVGPLTEKLVHESLLDKNGLLKKANSDDLILANLIGPRMKRLAISGEPCKNFPEIVVEKVAKSDE